MADSTERARAFLAGQDLSFEDADELWTVLKKEGETSLARRVLEKLRHGDGVMGEPPADRVRRAELCRQEALLTSKDPEMCTAIRHDRAIEILSEEFHLESAELDGDGETLGIAGGIFKRRWNDLGQMEDLRRAAGFYERGSKGVLGVDAYAHINAAFLDDLLAHLGDDPEARKNRARGLRERILTGLPGPEEVELRDAWFNTATRAEALFGLGRYEEAARLLAQPGERGAPWQMETTARQLATLAHLHRDKPLQVPEIRAVFEALLPGATEAVRSALAGKVGLALSGGGLRASFYHLGVLARLAELDVLRHVEVLSCVSGGSIVGACYWLALRERLLDPKPLEHRDYVALVRRVIDHFSEAVGTDLRAGLKPSWRRTLLRILRGAKGILDPEATASALEERFYRKLVPGDERIYMHHLPFTPADFDPDLAGSDRFHPRRHNWLRAHKVPALVLNATTVNTGHGWQFTPTWMGESPWASHSGADSVSRLEWSWYEPDAGWQMELSRAVAASACVPFIFSPLILDGAYDGFQVQLVDGGVHDNQGTVSLLAHDCNVVIVSDACGQLGLEARPAGGLKGLVAYAKRSMDILMERVRLANFADLEARKRTGLLRGLMLLHLKAGLDADSIPLRFSQASRELRREPLSPAGIRQDFQQALAELRTDLDLFTANESRALMACGYRMASWAFERDLADLDELWSEPLPEAWPFQELLEEITSTAAATPRREALLAELRRGHSLRV